MGSAEALPSDRIIRLPGGRSINYDKHCRAGRQEELDAYLAEWDALVAANPLEAFEPHGPQQRAFFEARTPIVAAFAGNQFGKTTSLVVRALIEVLPREVLPEHLLPFKRWDAPCYGWILVPTEEKVFDPMHLVLKRWVPEGELARGRWDKAWNGERMQLAFRTGSLLSFKTYKQDPSTLGGATLHFVGYDEPPPREHRDECMTRLLQHDGYEMFAMTPLKTNTGWIRRDIFKRRASPDITVVRGSMHDNPTLSKGAVERTLAQYTNDLWRRAREFGDFIDVGGLIYEGFEQRVLKRAPAGDFVRSLDVVVGIDPGIRNAAFVWVGFDRDNVAWVFDEFLVQDGTPEDYVRGLKERSSRWGLREVLYVIDPAARQRAQVNAETVQSALSRLGVHTMNGQNDVEAGIQQVRGRLQAGRIHISPDCVGLRDEADEYAAEDRPDGVFRPIKENDHRLDALRYCLMARPWFAEQESRVADRNLGWRPGVAPPAKYLQPAPAYAPMGPMS